MKKLLALAIAAALSHTAFAASVTAPAPAKPAGKPEKTCYKQVHDAETEASAINGYTIGVGGTSWGLMLAPCPAPQSKK